MQVRASGNRRSAQTRAAPVERRVTRGRAGPKYSSLSQMERDARGANDKTALWSIRSVVLQISVVRAKYEYRWGVNIVTRDVAHAIVVSAQ